LRKNGTIIPLRKMVEWISDGESLSEKICCTQLSLSNSTTPFEIIISGEQYNQ
jgi:hypothetical protein